MSSTRPGRGPAAEFRGEVTTHVHEGDLPAGGWRPRPRSRSIPRPWACASAATRCAWCSCRPATATPMWCSWTAPTYDAPNLKRLLTDPTVLKIFHFGRFDIAMFDLHLGVVTAPGLLHQDRLQAGPHLHRPPRPEGRGQASCSASTCPRPSRARTGAPPGSAARPAGLRRLGRPVPARPARRGSTTCWCARAATDLARACFDFLPHRARLDLAGWDEVDIFAHA